MNTSRFRRWMIALLLLLPAALTAGVACAADDMGTELLSIQHAWEKANYEVSSAFSASGRLTTIVTTPSWCSSRSAIGSPPARAGTRRWRPSGRRG